MGDYCKQINEQGFSAGQMSGLGQGIPTGAKPTPSEIIRGELHALVRLSEQLEEMVNTRLAPIMCSDYGEAKNETLATGPKLPPLFDDYQNSIEAIHAHMDEVVKLIMRVGI